MKSFNITGTCYPDKHYMVDITKRLSVMKNMIDKGEYFVINRGRQYGKTTTLSALCEYIQTEYVVFPISFEGMSEKSFQSAEHLAYAFLKRLDIAGDTLNVSNLTSDMKTMIKETLLRNQKQKGIDPDELSVLITKLCDLSEKPVVLMIDEVDQASGHRSFLEFLGLLRMKFLQKEKVKTFQSVILASVYDIKNLKLKMRPDEEHQFNSPWNIASDFALKMDFSKEEIAGMLSEYKQDKQADMDISGMADLLYSYTSGYPFLVSRLCKMLDENDKLSWNREGFLEAVKTLLNEERNTLFDDMIKKLHDFPSMKEMFRDILYYGKSYAFVIDDEMIQIAAMFGLIRNVEGSVKISNRIFETRLYNLFVFEESRNEKLYDEGARDKNQFIKDGRLDMKYVLERFIEHYTDIYGDRDEAFHEKEGRKFFMFYLKPIINGVGNYYIEAETRDATRTDMVVDYRGEQFVIEMKIWRGEAYNTRGEQQLTDYLEYFHTDTGYLLSFNFNKHKEIGIHEQKIGDKTIWEAVV